jgi:hypothetical protein
MKITCYSNCICISSIPKIRKIRFVNKGEACSPPKKTISQKHYVLLTRARHEPHPRNPNSKKYRFLTRHVPNLHNHKFKKN